METGSCRRFTVADGLILIGAVALGVAWVMDRRRQREYEELEEAV